MFDWLKDHKVPLSVAVSAIGTIVGAFVYGYLWLYAEFVTASQFVSYQSQTERRILLEKQQQLEAELLKIEVKCNAYPRRCDAVDKALMDRYRRDIQRVYRDLNPSQTQPIRR